MAEIARVPPDELAAIAENHVTTGDLCDYCGFAYPCHAVQLLGHIAALEAEHQAKVAELEAKIKELEEIVDGDKEQDASLWKILNDAAAAIKRGDAWPITHWPSPVERAWYHTAQERIAELQRRLGEMQVQTEKRADNALEVAETFADRARKEKKGRHPG